MIDIVINENPINHISEYDGAIVSTNCYQSMRNGFQLDVVKRYPYVLSYNYSSKYGDNQKLGTIIECKEDNKPLFILAFTTFGYNFKGNDVDFFDYNALVKCLKLINILYRGKKLCTTMIGCCEFDGNADMDRILDIINNEVKDFDLTIYDYKQLPFREANMIEYKKNLKKRYAKNKEKFRANK